MSTSRILLFSYILLAVIAGLVFEHLLVGVFAKVSALSALNNDALGLAGWSWTTVIGFALAAGAVFYCWSNATIKTLSIEVVDELQQVTWPSWMETRTATVAVVVASVVCAVLLGVFDYGWGMITRAVYGP